MSHARFAHRRVRRRLIPAPGAHAPERPLASALRRLAASSPPHWRIVGEMPRSGVAEATLSFLSWPYPRYHPVMRSALFCLLLTACAVAPDTRRHSARAIFDAYLIAHGMVKSYDERPDADPAISQQLSTLDIRASRALMNLAPGPDNDPDVTARAVAALSDYAAEQTNQASQTR